MRPLWPPLAPARHRNVTNPTCAHDCRVLRSMKKRLVLILVAVTAVTASVAACYPFDRHAAGGDHRPDRHNEYVPPTFADSTVTNGCRSTPQLPQDSPRHACPPTEIRLHSGRCRESTASWMTKTSPGLGYASSRSPRTSDPATTLDVGLPIVLMTRPARRCGWWLLTRDSCCPSRVRESSYIVRHRRGCSRGQGRARCYSLRRNTGRAAPIERRHRAGAGSTRCRWYLALCRWRSNNASRNCPLAKLLSVACEPLPNARQLRCSAWAPGAALRGRTTLRIRVPDDCLERVMIADPRNRGQEDLDPEIETLLPVVPTDENSVRIPTRAPVSPA